MQDLPSSSGIMQVRKDQHEPEWNKNSYEDMLSFFSPAYWHVFLSAKTMGRDKRLEYAASFENCYFFRLLYYAGTQYPIMGALRWSMLVLNFVRSFFLKFFVSSSDILRQNCNGNSALINSTECPTPSRMNYTEGWMRPLEKRSTSSCPRLRRSQPLTR